MSGVAARLVELVRQVTGVDPPVRVRAWDGSVAGPAGDPTVVLRSPRALRRLLWNPDELGLARAFVAGELEVEGDLADGLSRCWAAIRAAEGTARRRPPLGALGSFARWGVLGPRPRPPQAEARLRGRLHTRRRDRDAIAHHYDLSNDFYRFLLDSRMAYSCGYWTSGDATLEDAQRDKLDAVCRKLGLRPGGRHLDIGCGWGSLVIHAASEYGVHATGITLSARQRDLVTARVRELGLADRVDVRLLDYRSLDGAPFDSAPFDSVSSIEMGEHVGADNYPGFAAILHRMLVPGGRLLLQQMSRGTGGSAAHTAPGGGAFIERYVAPDMHMRPLGETVGLLESAGLEVVDVHSLREHYPPTVRAWLDTLEAGRAEAARLVGEQRYRVWRLYLAGGALAFAENRMGVHQILAARPLPDGGSGLPMDRAALLAGRPAEMAP